MGHAYRAVGWNRQKRLYDGVVLLAVAAWLASFAGVTWATQPAVTLETVLIRGLGSSAFFLLHALLCIGPLARLDPRFLPLLYNRRHLGVTLFALGLAHGVLALVQFHALAGVNPLVGLFTVPGSYGSLAGFPFQPLGAFALAILFLMAATSHDFWLANLGAPVWKALHMGVYLAYALLVLHVALGALQSEPAPGLALLLGAGLFTVVGLHLAAARRERPRDLALDDQALPVDAEPDGFVDVGPAREIPEGRAKLVCLAGDRVAVFRHAGKVSALSNACQHQNGPLGEGQVIDGCVTCPWHGYQYDPESGASPAPFTEAVPTFDVRVRKGRVLVRARPNPAGTFVAAAPIDPEPDGAEAVPEAEPPEQYVGWRERAPAHLRARLAGTALAFVLASSGTAAAAAWLQRDLALSAFEFGRVRRFEGYLVHEPYPMLRVPRPGAEAGWSRYLLVGPGKRGAGELLAGLGGEGTELSGRPVGLEGTLIAANGRAAIEVVPGSAELLTGASFVPAREHLGPRTLRGEIADSKCHLGVMNPGRRKVHRACAVHCIAGGIPPVLLLDGGRADATGAEDGERSEGEPLTVLLVGPSGEALNEAVLPVVGLPVEVRGELWREDDLLVLRADPAEIRRLGARGR